MPTPVIRLLRGCTGAAMVVVFVFSLVNSTQASSLPSSVTLETETFVQLMKHDEILTWYTGDNRPLLTYDREREFENWSSATCPILGFCDGFLSRQTRRHIILDHDLQLVPSAIKHSIDSFAAKADRDPKDARLSVRDGRVTIAVPSEDGILVDQAASAAILIEALQSNSEDEISVKIKSVSTPAKVSETTLSSLGITELLGTATTNFSGSPKNRIYNITRAIQDFDGIVIEPGATFSFVDHLGEVDGEHGYLPELVIKNNKTEPEFGGGICQVSTTVFRVALQSGLKITERRNHAYPVQYYKPYGMDATIYIPKPDLQFRNNTPGAILLVPSIDGMLLTFAMYGTKDGRTVTIDGPHILESNPDGSMKTVFTHTVTDKTGTAFIQDQFWSNYKSPSLFPHPGEEIFTEKPRGWSEKQWREYKKIHP